jgi:cation transport ATPase
MLTGEAQPVEKGSGDEVLASPVVLSGRIQIKVERAGNDTTAARIGEILNNTAMFKEKVETHSIALMERFTAFHSGPGVGFAAIYRNEPRWPSWSRALATIFG